MGDGGSAAASARGWLPAGSAPAAGSRQSRQACRRRRVAERARACLVVEGGGVAAAHGVPCLDPRTHRVPHFCSAGKRGTARGVGERARVRPNARALAVTAEGGAAAAGEEGCTGAPPNGPLTYTPVDGQSEPLGPAEAAACIGEGRHSRPALGAAALRRAARATAPRLSAPRCQSGERLRMHPCLAASFVLACTPQPNRLRSHMRSVPASSTTWHVSDS